jgi:hypothetical protein
MTSWSVQSQCLCEMSWNTNVVHYSIELLPLFIFIPRALFVFRGLKVAVDICTPSVQQCLTQAWLVGYADIYLCSITFGSDSMSYVLCHASICTLSAMFEGDYRVARKNSRRSRPSNSLRPF